MPESTAGPTVPENQITKVLLEWESPARVFVPKDDKYIRTVLWVLLAIGVILVFFKEFLLYAVFLALAFVSYVLRTVPPEKVSHKLTEYGLITGNHEYIWKDLKSFWFTNRGEYTILTVDTNLKFPPRLFILVPDNKSASSKSEIISILSSHILYRELPPEGPVDGIIDRLSQKFNLS